MEKYTVGSIHQLTNNKSDLSCNFSYCLSDKEYKELDRKDIEKATKLFETLEKILTTEVATPEREQVKKEFVEVFTGLKYD